MSNQGSSSDLNQASYRSTPYEDQEWEVVGEFKDDQTFIPEEFNVIGGATLIVDPMFADYGGLPPAAEVRVHGPIVHDQKYRASGIGSRAIDDEEKEDTRIKLEQHELDALLEQARCQGKIEALEESVTAHQQQLEKLQMQINEILKDIDAQFKERVVQVEQDAVQLSIDIAKKLIEGAVEINPEYILPILSEAIEKVGTASIRSVRVSPEDLEFMKIIGIENQLKEFDGSWTFIADNTISSGCVVDSSAGEIDFQLDKAWERLKDKILLLGKGHE